MADRSVQVIPLGAGLDVGNGQGLSIVPVIIGNTFKPGKLESLFMAPGGTFFRES